MSIFGIRLWFDAGYGCDCCGRKDLSVAKPKGGGWLTAIPRHRKGATP